MRSFFAFVALFLACTCFAQEGYDFGYIITNAGDTVKGKIKDRKYVAAPANWDKISFIDSSGEEKSKTPDEIKLYCKKGKMFFRSLPIGLEAKLKFAEILEYGDVILFGCVSNSFVSLAGDALSKSLDTKKDSKSAAKITTEYFFQKRKDANSLMKVRPKQWERTATFFFQDDEDLVQKIESKTLKYEDIRAVVKTYNERVAAKNK